MKTEWVGYDSDVVITDEFIKNANKKIISKKFTDYEIDKNKYTHEITKVSNFLIQKIESIEQIKQHHPESFLKIYNFNKFIESVQNSIDNYNNVDSDNMSMKINQYVNKIKSSYGLNRSNDKVVNYKEFECVNSDIFSEKFEKFKKEFKEFIELNNSIII